MKFEGSIRNELGNDVAIVVSTAGVAQMVRIVMLGPQSTTTNDITLEEARLLHTLPGHILAPGMV